LIFLVPSPESRFFISFSLILLCLNFAADPVNQFNLPDLPGSWPGFDLHLQPPGSDLLVSNGGGTEPAPAGIVKLDEPFPDMLNCRVKLRLLLEHFICRFAPLAGLAQMGRNAGAVITGNVIAELPFDIFGEMGT
jgi:hypothetical protein